MSLNQEEQDVLSKSGKGFKPQPKAKSQDASAETVESTALIPALGSAMERNILNTAAAAGEIVRQSQEANYQLGMQVAEALRDGDKAFMQGFMEAMGSHEINSPDRYQFSNIAIPTLDQGVRRLSPVERGEMERKLSLCLFGNSEELTHKRLSAAK